MSKPLAGLRVVDLTSVIFGPYCTRLLADMGAEIIKIESPEGDLFRYSGTPSNTQGMSPLHLILNQGKASVVLDLKLEDDRDALRALIPTADLFIHNIRLDAIRRLGFDYDAVRAIKPDIVYAHLTGFGSGGPYDGVQAYDDIIQAATGITTLLPRADGNAQPRYMPMAIADKVSGLYATHAVVAALFHRARTGEGQAVEVPMFESIAHFTLLEHLGGAVHVPPTGPVGYARQVDPNRQPFRTRDGWITVVPYGDRKWVEFFQLVGRADVLEDERLATREARAKNQTVMFSHMHTIFAERTTADWVSLLRPAGIPIMPVVDLDALPAHPQLLASRLLVDAAHPTEGTYKALMSPVRFSADPGPQAPASPAPLLGEHTALVSRR
jgi:crotonobetainyl-CoA:carnitine CoA-transferase CaiB-like acyl-CoA transferase